MSFARRVTQFTFNDQLEALEKLDFEKILKEDGPEDCYSSQYRGCGFVSGFRTTVPHIDEFESQYLLADPFASGDEEDTFGYGYGSGQNRLIGGNPANGTFTIALSSLASAICATILLHSCVKSWNQASHYLLCLLGLFICGVVLTNTLLAMMAVCLFKRCRSRKAQGTTLLKMHHALSLVSVLLLIIYCSCLERYWVNQNIDASEKFYFHYVAHINRNWMAFLCMLTTFSLSFGVIGNLNWPHWNEDHVAVLRWTLFSSSLISVVIGLVLIVLRVCLFVFLHTANDHIWGLQVTAGSSLLLVAFGLVGLFSGESPGKVKAYIFMGACGAVAMLIPSIDNLMLSFPYAVADSSAVAVAWLKTDCTNKYCADLMFALGAAGLGSLFFILIGVVSATMIRPYFVEGLADKK